MRFKKFWPIVFFAFLTLVFFYQYFFKQKLPIPADILLGHYHPWADLRWGGIQTIYPIKNWNVFDGIRQTLPWRLLAIKQLKLGQVPFWNQYNFSGTPLLGNWQTAAFHPLNFLFLFLPELEAWSFYIILQPFLAGLFSFYFLKDLIKKSLPAYLGAISWALSIIMINHLELGIDGHTILWLPLGLLAINRINEKPSILNGLMLSLAVLMALLGGYPPPAIYSLALIGLYAIFKIRPIVSKKLLLIVSFFFLGLLLSLPQTLPALKLIRTTEDVKSSRIIDSEYFFPIENLVMTFAPDFFGHIVTRNFSSPVYYSDSPAIGGAGFVFFSLSLILLFFQKKQKRSETVFWWLIAIVPAVFMIDNCFGRFLRDMPINLMTKISPIKMIWLISFSLSVLAAIGMSLMANIFDKKKRAIALFFPFLLILFFWFLSFKLPINHAGVITAQRNLILPSLVSLLILFLSLVTFKFKKFWLFVEVVVIMLAGGELIRQGWKYTPFVEASLIFPQTKITKYLQENSYGSRTIITNGELFPVNVNLIYSIPMIDGYASIRDKRYDYLVKLMDQQIGRVEEITSYPRIVYQPEWGSQVASLLGVKYILSIYEIDNPRLSLVLREGQTYLYENELVFDKVFFVENYWLEKDLDSIARRMLSIDLAKEVVIEKDLGDQDLGVGTAKIIDYQDNYILIETENEKDGLLVLNDAYDESWQVLVDQHPEILLRADLNLRAVLIPKGSHKVEFKYVFRL